MKNNKGLTYAVWSACIILSVFVVLFAVIFASCSDGGTQPAETNQVQTIE